MQVLNSVGSIQVLGSIAGLLVSHDSLVAIYIFTCHVVVGNLSQRLYLGGGCTQASELELIQIVCSTSSEGIILCVSRV